MLDGTKMGVAGSVRCVKDPRTSYRPCRIAEEPAKGVDAPLSRSSAIALLLEVQYS